MKNKFKILGALIVMAIAMFGAFNLSVPKYVFADDIAVQETLSETTEAGTFEGVGDYIIDQQVTLKATMNLGYEFDCWLATYEDGTTQRLSSDIEYSFKAERNMTVEAITKKAGTFTVSGAHATADGSSFYIVGESATLIAQMEPGFKFTKWIATDVDGDSITLPSDETNNPTNTTYSFAITQNVIITPTWEKLEYSVSFASGLDGYFTTEYTNEVQPLVNYYGDEIKISISLNPDLFVDNIDEADIIINNTDLKTIKSNNPMNINAAITNSSQGFNNVVITLNIKEDVVIDLDYTKMFTLTMQSGNDIDLSKLNKFISSTTGHYGILEDNIYLLIEGVEMNITLGSGDDIYKFESYQLQGMASVNNKYSASIKISENKTFTITYSIKDYTITFKPYLININNAQDVMTEQIYSIAPETVKPGESIIYTYDNSSKNIEIIGADGNSKTYEPANIYGYKFVGFEDENNFSDDYIMSDTAPVNKEIKIIFKYAEYSFSVDFVDDYFTPDVDLDIVINNGLKSFKNNEYVIVKGANVTIKATTDKYQINNWYFTNLTQPSGDASEILANGYTFTFEPSSETEYKIIIDVDYKYTTAKFLLDSNGTVYDNDENQYSAQLQISNIEQVLVSLTNGNTKATVTFNGRTYTMDESTTIYNEILKFETDVKSVEAGKYELNYQGYKIYLYMAENSIAENDKIILPNLTSSGMLHTTEFVYKEGAFKLENATVNTPDVVSVNRINDATNNPNEYIIELVNLLPNAVLIYSAKSTDTTFYKSAGVRNGDGRMLGNFLTQKDENGVTAEYINCLSPVTMYNVISVRYIKVQNKVYLQINDLQAYSYNDIKITLTDADGNVINNEITDEIQNGGIGFDATNGDIVIIEVAEDDISAGYKFDGYNYNFAQVQQDDKYILSFTMNNTIHANQIINIQFTPIEYNIKINIKGLGGSVSIGEYQNIAKVILTDSYKVIATAHTGYYTVDAYIKGVEGNENTQLASLISDNLSTSQVTEFDLNNTNFYELIISNAYDDNGEMTVDLYVEFTLRTYNIKVYFKIDSNEGIYGYPTLSINDDILELKTANENGSTVYYVQTEGLKYGSSVEIAIIKNSFREGIAFSSIKDVDGNSLLIGGDSEKYVYTISKMTKDSVYTVQLNYIQYTAVFKSVDTEGNENASLGEGFIDTDSSITLGSLFYYSVSSANGYALAEVYYKDKYSQKNNITNDFIDFDPQYFDIYLNSKGNHCFTIYLMFGYKVINLEINNAGIVSGVFEFKGMTINDLATFTVVRTRDNKEEILTDIYSVRMGDQLTITVNPISIGVMLNNISVGQDLIYSAQNLKSFTVLEKYSEDGQFEGVYYVINVTFDAAMIERLYEQLSPSKNYIELKNNLSVRQYNIYYSYNYINYKFKVQLSMQVGLASKYGHTDEPMSETTSFGSAVKFGSSYSDKDTDKDQFITKGFNVDGVEFNQTSLTLDDEKFWTDLALKKYKLGDNNINVNLLLTPRIFLSNFDKDSLPGEYKYTKIYNAHNQGLNNESNDVSVGGGFEVIIQYAYDGEFQTTKPKNVGDYLVKLIAIIKTEDSQEVRIEYGEKVSYHIKPKEITLTLEVYDQYNPINKEYNGLKTISSPATQIVPYIKLNGVCSSDEGNILIDASKVSAEFSGAVVNDETSLYDLKVEGIYLVDKTNRKVENYIISTGYNREFERVGKITPHELKIEGVIAYDKVNDGTTEVKVNIDKIYLSGKLGFDSTEIIKENLKFYHNEVDSKFKGPIKVMVDYQEAIDGADRNNYTIIYDTIMVNIHPYELEYYVNGVGTFKVVDYDKKCLIPLDAKIIAGVYARGNTEYNKMLTLTETQILKSENLQSVYEVVMLNITDGSSQAIPEGLYVYIPKVDKTTKIFQCVDDETVENVEHTTQDGFIVIQAQKGRTVFGLVVKTTYMPLWLIIVIVASSIAGIGLLVLIFIIIRKRSGRKYQRYDKI